MIYSPNCETTDQLKVFFENGRSIAYRSAEQVIRSGDTPNGVSYIAYGCVAVQMTYLDGTAATIQTLYPGTIFPLPGAMHDQSTEICYVALSELGVCRLTQAQFDGLYLTDTDFQRLILSQLSGQLAAAQANLVLLHQRRAHDRLVYRLLDLAEQLGRHGLRQVIIPLAVSHAMLARSTGMSRETASRIMTQLVRQRLVRRAEGKLIIADIDGLRASVTRPMSSGSSASEGLQPELLSNVRRRLVLR